jgi:hypothetical protein
VALSDDGRYAYSASPDRHAVWETQSGKPATEAQDNAVGCATFLVKEPMVAFGYQTQGIASIDLRVGVRNRDFEDRHLGGIECLAQSPDAYLIVSAGVDKSLRGWEPFGGRTRWEVLELPEVVTAVGLSADKRWMVTASPWTWTVWEMRPK